MADIKVLLESNIDTEYAVSGDFSKVLDIESTLWALYDIFSFASVGLNIKTSIEEE